MLRKVPQRGSLASALKKSIKVFLVGEFALALGSYGVYYKLNTDRDFRHYMSEKYAPVLEAYYQIGERIGGLKTREEDRAVWDLKK